MEQQSALSGIQELHSKPKGKEGLKSSSRRTVVCQPSWPGDNVRTGSSGRQPKIEVVCISMHRWGQDDPGTYALCKVRYVSGIKRQVSFTDLKAMDKFLEKRYEKGKTQIILDERLISMFNWILDTRDGNRFADAFGWDVSIALRTALDTNALLTPHRAVWEAFPYGPRLIF